MTAGAAQARQEDNLNARVLPFGLSVGFEILSAPLEPSWVSAGLHSSEKRSQSDRKEALGSLVAEPGGPVAELDDVQVEPDAPRPGAQVGTGPRGLTSTWKLCSQSKSPGQLVAGGFPDRGPSHTSRGVLLHLESVI